MHDAPFDPIPGSSPNQGEERQTVPPVTSLTALSAIAQSSTRNDEKSDETRAMATFDYAIIRVVPRIERGESLNVGVILFCSEARFLDAKIELNGERLKRFAPEIDLETIEEHLQTIPLICAGGKQAGQIGQMTQRERFHWLVAPRSTMIQTSVAHCGMCDDPQNALERLLEKLVKVSGCGS